MPLCYVASAFPLDRRPLGKYPLHTRAGSVFLLAATNIVGSAHRRENIQESDQYCASIIMINGRTLLQVIETMIMTAAKYTAEVLLPHVHLSCAAGGDNSLLMVNNVHCHRANAVQDYLERESIHRIM